jgi:hypothetical protein
MNAPTRKITAASLDLSAIMRDERIIDIHRDRLLDRFSVTLADFTMGIGGSVGEALADAQRRAA